jgi:glycogen operon protein
MSDEEWQHSYARCLGLFLGGEQLDEHDQRGQRLHDDNFLLLFNAHHEEIAFRLPRFHAGTGWEMLLDTDHAGGLSGAGRYAPETDYALKGRSLALLREVPMD